MITKYPFNKASLGNHLIRTPYFIGTLLMFIYFCLISAVDAQSQEPKQVLTTLSGYLNGMDTLKIEDSPFEVTGTIFFTSGTHVIDPGVVIMFNPGTRLEIGQANMKIEGTVTDSIIFTGTSSETGDWNGVYFNTQSDNGVSSTMSYTRIDHAGSGTYNANLYCSSTSSPSISNCTFKQADGIGLRLVNSNPTISDCDIENNHTGVDIDNPANVTVYMEDCLIQNNSNTGLRSDSWVELTNSLITNNNVYEIDAVNPQGFPTLNHSSFQEDATSRIRIGGGNLDVNQTWPYCSNGYEITGQINLFGYLDKKTLTIEAGNTLYFTTVGRFRVGQSASYGGEMVAQGTNGNEIVFTSLDPGDTWDGLWFDDGSGSYGGASVLEYCIIENGNGYNVRVEGADQPLQLNNCILQNAAGDGLQIVNGSTTANDCFFQDNVTGISIANGNGTTYLNNCTVQNNTQAGIESNDFIELTNSLVTNNAAYEIDATNPNGFPKLTNSTIAEVGSSMVRVAGGALTVNRTWPAISNGYEITGQITLYGYLDKRTLTIEAGNTLYLTTNGRFRIGQSTNYGGELIAQGTSGNEIIFTSLNPGENWLGILFDDGSGSYGSASFLEHCIIENGNAYNVRIEGAEQPLQMDHCTFQNAAGDGLQMVNASATANDCFFQGNATGISIANGNGTTYLNNCTVQNNMQAGIESNDFIELTNSLVTNNTVYEVDATSPNGFPKLTSSSIVDMGSSMVRVAVGTLNVNRTWPYISNGYEITGTITISGYLGKRTLTIEAGNVLRFTSAGKFRIGQSTSYGGELKALGTADDMITFTALDPAGTWGGILFNDGSGSYGSMSQMQYCLIEKGIGFNVQIEASDQTVQFDHCILQNATGKGLNILNASMTANDCFFQDNQVGVCINNGNGTTYMNNCTIQNNTTAGIESNDFIELTNSLVTNNTIYEVNATLPNGFPKLTNSSIVDVGGSIVQIAGGSLTVDRILPYIGNGYEVTGLINLSQYQGTANLTIDAGNEIRFASNGKIRIGQSTSYGGELHIMGTADDMVTLTSLGGKANWNGLQFDVGSSAYGSVSILQYAVIEHGLDQNIYINSSTQPELISFCEISGSNGYGIRISNGFTTIENSSIINNNSYGVYLTSGANAFIGNFQSKSCDLYYNGGYDVYNATSNLVNAGSNFWNTKDTSLISMRIYDYHENSQHGVVYQYPFESSGFIPLDLFDISGKVTYNNGASTELAGMDVNARDILGNIKETATTNGSGDYMLTGLENANYTFSGSGIDWGGGNATDALLILQHFTAVNPLTGLNLRAGDVNGSNSVNGTDALLVLSRFASVINSFPMGDWIFSDSVTLYGDDQLINFMVNCYGDVNNSFIPASKDPSTIQLIAEGSLGIAPNTEYEIPVTVKHDLEAGAVSLILYYPETYLEIEYLTLADGNTVPVWSAENGNLKVAWADLNPLTFGEDEIVLKIGIKTKDLSGLTDPIVFVADPLSEVADGEAAVWNDVTLAMPHLITGVTGTASSFELVQLKVRNYPDPFNQKTTMEFMLPEQGRVNWILMDGNGNVVFEHTSGLQSKGKYLMLFDGTALDPGVYIYRAIFKNETAIGKMIISR